MPGVGLPSLGQLGLRGSSGATLLYAALAASIALNLAWLEQYYGAGVLFPMLGLKPASGVAETSRGLFNADELDAVDLLFEFPGEDECGQWASNYTLLHKKILKGDLPRKFITLLPSPTNRTGDTLMGLVSVFLAALFTDRALIIADPALASVFDPVNIDWRAGPHIPLTPTAGGPGSSASVADSKPGAVLYLDFMNKGQDKNSMVTLPESLGDVFGQFSEADNILVATNGGVLTRIFSNNTPTFRRMFYGWGFRIPTAYGCIVRYLMRPHREIVDSIRQPVQLMQREWTKSVCLGLQDTAVENDTASVTSAANVLLQTAASIEEYWFPPSWKVYYLFSSDSAAARDAAVAFDSAKVWLLKNASSTAEHRPGSQELKDTIAEWLLFSNCNYYAFTDSTFVKSSFGYNIWAPLVFHYPPLSEKLTIPPPSDASHGHSLLSLKEWNGL